MCNDNENNKLFDERERELIMMHKKTNDFMRVINSIKQRTHARVDVDIMLCTINSFSLLYELICNYDSLNDDERENIDDVFNECIMRSREL